MNTTSQNDDEISQRWRAAYDRYIKARDRAAALEIELPRELNSPRLGDLYECKDHEGLSDCAAKIEQMLPRVTSREQELRNLLTKPHVDGVTRMNQIMTGILLKNAETNNWDANEVSRRKAAIDAASDAQRARNLQARLAYNRIVAPDGDEAKMASSSRLD